MTSAHWIRAAAACLVFACAQSCNSSKADETAPEPSPNPAQAEPIDVTADGDYLTLAVAREGIPVEEFIKLGQVITGKTFTYSKRDLDPECRITFVGKKKLKKEEFFAFFQTMLYVNGLSTVVRGQGDAEIIEIVPKRTKAG